MSRSSSKLKIEAPAPYRAQFEAQLNAMAACSGKPLKKRTYRLTVYPGTRRVNGAWQAPMPLDNAMQWGRTINGSCHVAADPKTGAIDAAVLQHEALHAMPEKRRHLSYTARSGNPHASPDSAVRPKCNGLQLNCNGIPWSGLLKGSTGGAERVLNAENAPDLPDRVIPVENRVLSRDFSMPADGWYHLVPKGEHAAVDTKGRKVVQVVDEEAVQRILARFSERSAAADFAGVLIDWEHFSYDPAKKSEAAGWIMDLQSRADGVWGRIRWSDAGERDVKGGAYRFISPSLDYERIQGNRVRPKELTDAGLTNVPRFKSLKPLSNREGDGLPAQPQNGGKNMEWLKELLLKVLGLADDASDDDIKAAAAKAMTPAEQQEMKQENEALATQNRGLLTDLAEHDLREYADVIETPDDVRDGLVNNRDVTLKVLRGLRKKPLPQQIHNRDTTKRPAGSPTDGASKKEKSKDQLQRDAVHEYRVRNKCTFEEAWAGAKSEKPELFEPEAKAEE